MKQLNIRLEEEIYREFAAACELTALSMNQCFAILADVYSKNIKTGETFHINGAPCPVTSMIQALATATQQEIRTRQQRAAEWKNENTKPTEPPRHVHGETPSHRVPPAKSDPTLRDRGGVLKSRHR